MISGIHFILTYMCNRECDHCFLYCGPMAQGTFTLCQVRELLDEAQKMGTVKHIYFEGGEPFLFYPLLVKGVEMARERGFHVGVVTNAYFATSPDDAELWLTPLAHLGLFDLSISDDLFHRDEGRDNPAVWALTAAERLNIPVETITIEKPVLEESNQGEEGKSVIGGSTLFKGRAVERLITGLPLQPWREWIECPYEDLQAPERIHVDPLGFVHLCQGVTMGNCWDLPLSTLVANYDAVAHPICGPLFKGGPAFLACKYLEKPAGDYVDACHCCYVTRRTLLDRFPSYLAPKQVYGLEEMDL